MTSTPEAADAPQLDRRAAVERVQLDDHAWVDVAPGWMRGSDTLFAHLARVCPWRQGRRFAYDHTVEDPRLGCGYPGTAEPPHPVLGQARLAIEARYGVAVSGPQLNWYRDGRDRVAMHRDRELRRLDDTLVAILTLGARRPFLMAPYPAGARGSGAADPEARAFAPAGGDLIVLGGRAQLTWLHGVPRVDGDGARISVMWRWTSGHGRPMRGAGYRAPRRYT